MHPDNAFYGHNHVLARYVGAESPPPIWGHLQHGWQPGTGVSHRRRLVGWLPKLVWARHNEQASRAVGITPVRAIGAPFLYLQAIGERLAQPDLGTIFYPFHGWERAGVVGSHVALADAIAERDGSGSTVCLHWVEHSQPEVRRVYDDHGFRVVTHGRRHDPTFLDHLHDEMSRHRRVASNRVATAIWYGGALNREIEVYGPVFGLSASDGEAFARFQRAEWPALCDGGLGAADARAAAGEELGEDQLLPPEELAAALGWTGWRRRAAPLARPFARLEHHARRGAMKLRGGGS